MSDYPTKSSLAQIREWPADDPHGLMSFVEELWSYPDYFKRNGNTYRLSTGGWSGNESIIEALEDNIFWFMFWEKSERGGHYEFKVKEIK